MNVREIWRRVIQQFLKSASSDSDLWHDFYELKRDAVGPAACDYYMNAFNHTIHWNWSAFLFGAVWLAYRKMYKNAFILCLINTVRDFVAGLILVTDVFPGGIENLTSEDYVNSLLNGTNGTEANLIDTDAFFTFIGVYFVFMILERVFMGLFGNAIYNMRCEKVASIAQSKDPVDRLRYLGKKSGTNGWGIPIVLAYVIGLYVLQAWLPQWLSMLLN